MVSAFGATCLRNVILESVCHSIFTRQFWRRARALPLWSSSAMGVRYRWIGLQLRDMESISVDRGAARGIDSHDDLDATFDSATRKAFALERHESQLLQVPTALQLLALRYTASLCRAARNMSS